MARSVSLTKTPQRNEDQGLRCTFTAVGTEMASEIFVMANRLADPTRPAGAVSAVFDHIASPTEIEQLPISAPLAGSVYFRVAAFTKAFQTEAQASQAWLEYISDVNALIRALNAGAGAPETIVLTG